MFDIFSTREIAGAIWFFIFLLFILHNRNIRKSVIELWKAATQWRLVLAFLISIAYYLYFTFLFSKMPFWDWFYLKDIVFWVLFAGIPSVIFSYDKATKEGYFKELLFQNITLSAALEFFLSSFTFPFWVEMLLVPFASIIVISESCSRNKKEYKDAHSLLSIILLVLGLWILCGTINVAINELLEINAIDSFVSFAVPIVYTLISLPFIYCFAVYTRYETLLGRMVYFNKKQNVLNRKIKVIMLCKLSLKRITICMRKYPRELYSKMTDNEFNDLILRIKKEW